MTNTTNITVDRFHLAELQTPGDYSNNARAAALKVVGVARALCAAGRGYGARKAFICEVAAELDMSVARIARLLVLWQAAGFLSLARADLVVPEYAERIAASEIASLNATFHYIVID